LDFYGYFLDIDLEFSSYFSLALLLWLYIVENRPGKPDKE